MSEQRTVWNSIKCLDFLRKFDAFEHKYLYTNGKVQSVQSLLDDTELNKYNDLLNSQNHGASGHALSCEQSAEAAQGIQQVYGDEATHYTSEYIEMLDLVRDKFIFDYTGIAELCDFFSPAYFEYEWGMHLEIDYKKHDSRYYRDHYIHQIRNLYEMFTLLDKHGYYDKCYSSYCAPENDIGSYIFAKIDREILSLPNIDRVLYNSIISIMEHTASSDPCPGNCCIDKLDENREKISALMFRHIIYSATIIAAIVHDIGYPLSYIRRICERVNRSLPSSRLFTNVNRDYAQIKEDLKQSLLFTIVKSENIEERLNNNDEHGAQSAVTLLMYFHNHDQGLSTLQRCAIELAALVIYNHTNKYSVIDKPSDKPELVRSDIYKEPLSHVFRMCDDMQEWDRVYFEITKKSNLFVCPNCHMPMIRKFDTDTKRPSEKKYRCFCKDKKDPGVVYDTSMFTSRRIINVIGCNRVDVSDLTINHKLTKNSNATMFKMHYDCGALLNAVVFSASYGRIRSRCIEKVKCLCSYQGAQNTMLIDLFVSSNPIIIKLRILELFAKEVLREYDLGSIDFSDIENKLELERLPGSGHFRNYIKFYIHLKELGQDFYTYAKDKLSSPGSSFSSLGINTTNKGVLDGYNKPYDEVCKKLCEKAKKNLMSNYALKPYFTEDETLYELCIDYLMQCAHMVGYDKVRESIERPNLFAKEDIQLNNLQRRFYEKLYCSSPAFDHSVNQYVSRARYDNYIETGRIPDNELDFYVDYGLFMSMWEKVLEVRSYYFDSKLNVLSTTDTSINKSIQLMCVTDLAEFMETNKYLFQMFVSDDADSTTKPKFTCYVVVSLDGISDYDNNKFVPHYPGSSLKSLAAKALDKLLKHHGIKKNNIQYLVKKE